VGTGMNREERLALSRLIDLINERFGADLNDADQLFFDQIVEAAAQNQELEQAAKVNSLDKFRLVFNQTLDALFIERMELNEELFAEYMGKSELRDLITTTLGKQVYKRFEETRMRGQE
jgi:type I restriction enzyme R subunit